jgi:5-methylcytosine-specific restriction endonuclease McrA
MWSLSVADLPGKWNRGEIIIDRDWQREYIWDSNDERLLIDSVLKGMPIPKFYLTQEYDQEKQAPIQNVVDGQQRLTALYKFVTNGFFIEQEDKQFYFKDLDSHKKQQIMTYELNGHYLTEHTQYDITFLYDRLNSTGIKLTNMESWKSKYRNTNVLQTIQDILKENKKYYQDIIYTRNNVLRLLPLDDIIDICNCIIHQRIVAGNKKDLQKFLEDNKPISAKDSNQVKRQFRKTINIMKEIFSKEELQASNFSKRTHFISLFMAILFTGNKYYLLGQVNEMRKELLDFMNNPPQQYKESVTGGIRHKDRRTKRVNFFTTILSKYAVELDKKRYFDKALKMKLWQEAGGHQCKLCNKLIHKFSQSTVDHIIPWAKGGKTEESNAQLAHINCNKKKRDNYEKYIVE